MTNANRVGAGRVLVVDGWDLLARGIRSALARSHYVVAATVPTLATAESELRSRKVELVVVGLVAEDAGTAVRSLLRVAPEARVLLLIDHIESATVRVPLEAGASGVLLRSCGERELLQAVRHVAQGERYVTPNALLAAVGAEVPGADHGPSGGQRGGALLTYKEIEVLRVASGGASNAEIADKLYVSVATVKTHLAHMYAKLGVSNRREAVARAVELGLLV